MADHIAGMQTKLVVQSMKTRISQKIVDLLSNLQWLKYISFDKIKLLVSDFQAHELPAVQIIDVTESIEHQQVRALRTWQLALELVMKPTDLDEITQEDLWNYTHIIERTLWRTPNLGIPGVIHLVYLGNETDLHLLQPFYFARMDFEVKYYDHLVRDC